MRKNQHIYFKFWPLLPLCVVSAGCIVIPMGTEEYSSERGDESFFDESIDVIEFRGIHCEIMHELDGDHYQFWIDGKFRINTLRFNHYFRERKLSFGLFPGIMVPSPSTLSKDGKHGDNDPIGIIWRTTYMCGIPLLDAILIEPFSPYSKDINTQNIAQSSVFGFCKYLRNDLYQELSSPEIVDSYTVGKFLMSNISYSFLDPASVDSKKPICNVRVRVASFGAIRGSLFECLSDFIGVEMDVKVIDTKPKKINAGKSER